jgi:hypothetical protein
VVARRGRFESEVFAKVRGTPTCGPSRPDRLLAELSAAEIESLEGLLGPGAVARLAALYRDRPDLDTAMPGVLALFEPRRGVDPDRCADAEATHRELAASVTHDGKLPDLTLRLGATRSRSPSITGSSTRRGCGASSGCTAGRSPRPAISSA